MVTNLDASNIQSTVLERNTKMDPRREDQWNSFKEMGCVRSGKVPTGSPKSMKGRDHGENQWGSTRLLSHL